MAWAATIGAAGSVIAGGLSMGAQSSADKDARKAQQVNMNAMNQAYSPVNLSGPGGMGITFGGGTLGGAPAGGGTGYDAVGNPVEPYGTKVYQGSKGTFYSDGQGGRITAEGLQVVPGTRGKVKRSDIGNVNIGLGDMDPIRSSMVGMAGDTLNQAAASQGAAMDPMVQQAFAQFLNAGQQGLPQMMGGAGQMFGNTLAQAQGQFDNPFAQGLTNSLLGQSQAAFDALPGTAEARQQQALNLMREQAQPFEERAFSNLQDKLFMQGQGGTSGGGLQMEAFARGLSQADTSRQLQAMQEGRAAAQHQMAQGTGMATQAMGLQGLQDQLLTGATNRFNATGAFAQGLQNQQYGQALSTLQNIFAPQQLQQQLTGGYLGHLNNLNTGIGAINQQGIDFANLSRGFMADQANTRVGAGSQITPIQNNNATALAQLSGALMPQGGLGGVWSAWQNRAPSGGGNFQATNMYAQPGVGGGDAGIDWSFFG